MYIKCRWAARGLVSQPHLHRHVLCAATGTATPLTVFVSIPAPATSPWLTGVTGVVIVAMLVLLFPSSSFGSAGIRKLTYRSDVLYSLPLFPTPWRKRS